MPFTSNTEKSLAQLLLKEVDILPSASAEQ
jgi:hypothetical protein